MNVSFIILCNFISIYFWICYLFSYYLLIKIKFNLFLELQWKGIWLCTMCVFPSSAEERFLGVVCVMYISSVVYAPDMPPYLHS